MRNSRFRLFFLASGCLLILTLLLIEERISSHTLLTNNSNREWNTGVLNHTKENSFGNYNNFRSKTVHRNDTVYKTSTGAANSFGEIRRKSVYLDHNTKIKTSTGELMCTFHKVYKEKHYVLAPGHLGRFGNWLFQVAATFGIADAVESEPLIESSNPFLKVFDMDPMYISKFNLTNVSKMKQDFWKDDDWIKHINFSNHNVSLHGYFQSPRYFSNATACVREMLVIKPNILFEAKQFLDRGVFHFKTLIGVHIRRTDMLTEASKNFGRNVASQYYVLKAIEVYRKRFKNAHFIVCSDDLDWSRKTINGSDVTFSTFDAPVDFAILTLCDHMVITVGTFGWWAGWLAGGMVIYLSDYARPGSLESRFKPKDSYYPSNWIGISNQP